jgi:nucleoside-diphosphate-sugar epimerase
VTVVTMADGCDDARQIDELVRLVGRGAAVAAASRYMPGGQQVGGPVLKGSLSRLAGRSLRMLGHVGTRDATNCVGIGESRAVGVQEILSGNIRLAMSHVVPDLVQKVLKGQDPLRILGSGDQVRHYTYGGDLAVGVVTAMEHDDAFNEDFNLSTTESTTVRQLAELVWRKIKGGTVPLRLVHDDPFEYDVKRRIPDTVKAKKVLGFEATTTLDEMLDELIPWIGTAIKAGTI